MSEGDPFNLQRFVDAQAGGVYEAALAELKAGRKRGHWMWFILPQLRGLGRSAMSEFYGISGVEEARAYLAHPLLGPRLRECVAAVQAWEGEWTVEEMLGPVDAMKWRSCLALFEGSAGGHRLENGRCTLRVHDYHESAMSHCRAGVSRSSSNCLDKLDGN